MNFNYTISLILDSGGDSLKLAKGVAWLGLLSMTAVLCYGFISGDFFKDGSELLANPWGVVSMVDLYTGFILFSMWIVFRESSRLWALVWLILMMVLGFFAGSLYILLALYRSKGSWLDFFLGEQNAKLIDASKP